MTGEPVAVVVTVPAPLEGFAHDSVRKAVILTQEIQDALVEAGFRFEEE